MVKILISVDCIMKDRIFNAVSQAGCLLGGGGGVIGRVRAGSGSPYLADRSGVAGLTGVLCGQYPVPRHECACAGRGAAIGRNRREGAYPLNL
jgi:hypothetical protein